MLLPGTRPPTASPPLQSNAFVLETRFLAPIPSREVVRVGIDDAGRPVRVAVLQRLVVVRPGDYTFAIPAPVVDVGRAPGSQSEPGLRRGAILWAGFSPGRRVLAADAELVLRRAAPFLPLGVSVRRAGTDYVFRLENRTRVRVRTFAAAAEPQSLAAAVAATQRAIRRDEPMGDAFVRIRAAALPVRAEIAAPLRVTGDVRSGAESRPVAATLGDGDPLVTQVRVRAAGATSVRLRVQPLAPVRTLAQRGGDTRARLARVISARLQLARSRQYESFLAVPDRNAKASAVFVYATTTARAVPRPPARVTGGGARTLAVVGLVAAGILALGGGVVWWANS